MYENFEQDIIVHQDNTPIHVSNDAKDWPSKKGIVALDYRARSPGVNPIENIWAIVAIYVYQNGDHFNNRSALKKMTP